ncbi:MAG: hypothetical protein IPM18_02320 [Phycisphaerales bacterium]|nr:hypothetical protein [Phycisphaerales bacterium]
MSIELHGEYSDAPAKLDFAIERVMRDDLIVRVRAEIRCPMPGAIALEFHATDETVSEFRRQSAALARALVGEACLSDAEGAVIVRVRGVPGTREWFEIQADVVWPAFPSSRGGPLAEALGSGFRASFTGVLVVRHALLMFAEDLQSMIPASTG